MRRNESTTIVRTLSSFGVAIALVALAGCGSTVAHRRERAMTPEVGATAGGSSWNTVLAPERAADADLVWPGDGAYARRDAELALRIDGPIDAVASSWPQPERLSLEDSRRLYINRQAESMLYFRDRHRGHGYRSRHW